MTLRLYDLDNRNEALGIAALGQRHVPLYDRKCVLLVIGDHLGQLRKRRMGRGYFIADAEFERPDLRIRLSLGSLGLPRYALDSC